MFKNLNCFSKSPPDKAELASLLSLEDFFEVFEYADSLCRLNFGENIYIRALLEFSNHCKRKCSYCGLNSGNKTVHRFRMTANEIISSAYEAHEAGYKTIVLQSGEDLFFTPELLGDIVKEIKKCGIAITLSCGELSYEAYKYLYECGADRYLLKHETADEALYASLHPCGSLKNRIECLKNLKAIGYETGGGFMIGLPKQTNEIIARDLLLIKEIPCDMAGIGPFIPSPDTKLKNEVCGSTELTLRAVALARILLPNAYLPATTALGVLDKEQKDRVFSCGANVIMQKITPDKYIDDYKIYPSSIKPLNIFKGRKKIEEEIISMGKTPI